MTNDQTESLLSRFAAVSQRLQGTGAPGVPEWIETIPGKLCNDNEHFAAMKLAGYVMWAMKVAEWAVDHKAIVAVNVPRFWQRRQWRWRVHKANQWLDTQGEAVDHPTACCDMLESIADAIGGG